MIWLSCVQRAGRRDSAGALRNLQARKRLPRRPQRRVIPHLPIAPAAIHSLRDIERNTAASPAQLPPQIPVPYLNPPHHRLQLLQTPKNDVINTQHVVPFRRRETRATRVPRVLAGRGSRPSRHHKKRADSRLTTHRPSLAPTAHRPPPTARRSTHPPCTLHSRPRSAACLYPSPPQQLLQFKPRLGSPKLAGVGYYGRKQTPVPLAVEAP
jgi:hypothetical protein